MADYWSNFRYIDRGVPHFNAPAGGGNIPCEYPDNLRRGEKRGKWNVERVKERKKGTEGIRDGRKTPSWNKFLVAALIVVGVRLLTTIAWTNLSSVREWRLWRSRRLGQLDGKVWSAVCSPVLGPSLLAAASCRRHPTTNLPRPVLPHHNGSIISIISIIISIITVCVRVFF